MFDTSQSQTVSATVVAWHWTNPHVFLEVVDKHGGMHWDLESASPSILSRGGITRTTFKAGDKVTVKLHPRRDNARSEACRPWNCRIGKVLSSKPAATAAPSAPPENNGSKLERE